VWELQAGNTKFSPPRFLTTCASDYSSHNTTTDFQQQPRSLSALIN